MNQFSSRAGKFVLAALLVLGLAIRLGWGWHESHDPRAIDRLPDQREYLELGTHLLRHQGLWFVDPRFYQVVYAYRTPGYPAFIALNQGSPRAVRITQALLDSTVIFAIWLLARRWLSPWACVVAALLVALDPFQIYFTGQLLSETLFTAMMVWGIALLVLSDGPWPRGGPRLIGWIGGGLLLALSVLVRPGAFALPVVLGCGAALLNRRSQSPYRSQGHSFPGGRRWPLPVAATMLLWTALALLPWAARNRWVLGHWIWTSTNSGVTTYDGFNPDATGASDQSFLKVMPWTRDMTEVARSRYFADLADEWMHAHPLLAIELGGIKILRTWSPRPLSAEYGGRWIYTAAALGFCLVFYFLIFAGLWLGNLPGPLKRFLLLPALYLTAAAALSVGSIRYRIPAQPPMAILAASVFHRRGSAAVHQASPMGVQRIGAEPNAN